MKTKLLLILFAITSTIAFDSCLKKGEDDPFISLHSRKARVAGDWKVVSYKYTYTYKSFTNPTLYYTEISTMNGSTYTSVNTDASGTTTTNGIMTWEWTFEKDGKYKYTMNEDGGIETSAGTWNFTSGVGDLKNKSQIVIYEQSSTSSSGGTGTVTGSYEGQAFDLAELRSKKMKFYYKTNFSSSDFIGSDEVEIELEAK